MIRKNYIKNKKFKIGDYVLVTRKAYNLENGWKTYWNSIMDQAVGKIFKIKANWHFDENDKNVNSFYLEGEFETNCVYPSFILRLIKKVKVPKWKKYWKDI